MRCLYCDKKISVLKRLKNDRYCCPEHELKYKEQRDKKALETLAGNRSPIFDPPPPRPGIQATGRLEWRGTGGGRVATLPAAAPVQPAPEVFAPDLLVLECGGLGRSAGARSVSELLGPLKEGHHRRHAKASPRFAGAMEISLPWISGIDNEATLLAAFIPAPTIERLDSAEAIPFIAGQEWIEEIQPVALPDEGVESEGSKPAVTQCLHPVSIAGYRETKLVPVAPGPADWIVETRPAPVLPPGLGLDSLRPAGGPLCKPFAFPVLRSQRERSIVSAAPLETLPTDAAVPAAPQPLCHRPVLSPCACVCWEEPGNHALAGHRPACPALLAECAPDWNTARDIEGPRPPAPPSLMMNAPEHHITGAREFRARITAPASVEAAPPEDGAPAVKEPSSALRTGKEIRYPCIDGAKTLGATGLSAMSRAFPPVPPRPYRPANCRTVCEPLSGGERDCPIAGVPSSLSRLVVDPQFRSIPLRRLNQPVKSVARWSRDSQFVPARQPALPIERSKVIEKPGLGRQSTRPTKGYRMRQRLELLSIARRLAPGLKEAAGTRLVRFGTWSGEEGTTIRVAGPAGPRAPRPPTLIMGTSPHRISMPGGGDWALSTTVRPRRPKRPSAVVTLLARADVLSRTHRFSGRPHTAPGLSSCFEPARLRLPGFGGSEVETVACGRQLRGPAEWPPDIPRKPFLEWRLLPSGLRAAHPPGASLPFVLRAVSRPRRRIRSAPAGFVARVAVSRWQGKALLGQLEHGAARHLSAIALKVSPMSARRDVLGTNLVSDRLRTLGAPESLLDADLEAREFRLDDLSIAILDRECWRERPDGRPELPAPAQRSRMADLLGWPIEQ